MKRALLAGVLTAIALAAIPTAGAQAASGCYDRGPDRSRWVGNGIPFLESYHTWYCYAYRSDYLVENGNNQGYLYAGTSWFVCQKKWQGQENPAVGSARNDWWLWTLGDVQYVGGWGWFPATKISGGGNYQPIPGNLPTCNTVPGSYVTAGSPHGV
jgi:hypothetical protein